MFERDQPVQDETPGRVPNGQRRTVVVRVDQGPQRGRFGGMSRAVVLAGLVIVVVVGLAVMLLGQGGGGRHADGAGILASTGSSGREVFDREARFTGPFAGAIRLCLARGSEAAVIQSVGPDKVVGATLRSPGASVRVFTPSEGHSPIVSMDGYPPALPDPLQPAVGFAVTTPCGDVASGISYTELLIGFDPTAPEGGGWDGIDVTYKVGATQYVLVVNQAFVQCGTAALPGFCGGS